MRNDPNVLPDYPGPANTGTTEMGDFGAFYTPGCVVQIFGNFTLMVFTVEIFLRLRQFAICRSYGAFFTDPFCILDFTLVAVDLVVLVVNLVLSDFLASGDRRGREVGSRRRRGWGRG